MEKRINYKEKPKTFEFLGDGTYYYNYDIQQILIEQENEESIYEWSCIQVMLYGQPSYQDCVKAIIRVFVPQEDEFKLVNNYNSYVLGIGEEVSKENYISYLNLLKEIKTKVKADFE